MDQLLQATADGITLAPVYILAAIGFVIIFRATAVFNFAQGSLMMLGGYAVYELSTKHGLPAAAGMALAAVLIALLGGATYLIVLKPLTGQPVFAQIIVTMALAIVAAGPAGVFWGFSTLPIQSPSLGGPMRIGTVRVAAFDAWALVVTIGVTVGLALFFRYAGLGLYMRATAESPNLASRRGVSIQRIYTLAWVLAGATAGLAGTIVAFRTGAGPSIANVGLLAFPAALIGGFDSLLGAVVGGVLIALARTYVGTLWGPQVEDVVVFGLMLAVLLVRPYGLFGTPEIQRV